MDSERALSLAQSALENSTKYIEANYEADWDYSIRAFRNEHPTGSKYLSDDYRARSRLFNPKTRTIIRKNEAAAAMALFSNADVVNLEAANPDDPNNVAATQCLKAVLEYRLTKLSSFELAMGAYQDAQTQGAVCSFQYWKYEERDGEKIKDEPCVELVPIENIRFHPGASWIDPVNTSPFFAQIIPMFVCDLKEKMEVKDPKTGKPPFKTYDDGIIRQAMPEEMDRVRQARRGNQELPEEVKTGIDDFDIIHVIRWAMKDGTGKDWFYETLGTVANLTDPVPLKQFVAHGKRPWVLGRCIIETHKPIPTSLPVLVKPLQQEINDITNQRLDNVKFVLNKRWLVARGRQVDTQSLVRNVAGGVTLTTDPKTDVVESNWPDVTSSSFVEHDRLNSSFDDLAGNFSPNTKVANNAVNDTLGGSRMANMSAGIMSDYLLRTFIETWWEPVLRQLVLLERYYENDEVVLTLCAKKAKLFPHFGPQHLSQMIEAYDCDVKVNVGMGASDPQQKLQKYLMATEYFFKILAAPVQGAQKLEMAKELWSLVGYRDGSRFMEQNANPQVAQLMQIVQQLKGQLEGKQMELQFQGQLEQLRIGSAEKQKQWQLMVDRERVSGEQAIKQQQLELERASQELEALKIQAEIVNANEEIKLRIQEVAADIRESEAKLDVEKQKHVAEQVKAERELLKGHQELQLGQQEIARGHQELAKGQQDLESRSLDLEGKRLANEGAKLSNEGEKTKNEAAKQSAKSAETISKDVAELKKLVAQATQDNEALKSGIVTIAQVVQGMNKKEPKVKSVTKVKGPDGKLQKLIRKFDDETSDEITVN